MMSTWSRTVCAWLTGVMLALAAASAAALPQVSAGDESRLARQQRIMDNFEDFLRRLATAQRSGNCRLFEEVDASYFRDLADLRDMSDADFPPGWLRRAHDRKDAIRRAGCAPGDSAGAEPRQFKARLESWLDGLQDAARRRDCEEFARLRDLRNPAGTFPLRPPGERIRLNSVEYGVDWVGDVRRRLDEIMARGCSRADASDQGARPLTPIAMTMQPYSPVVTRPFQSPLPPVRPRELDWSPDLYQRYREQVEGLRELRADGQCEGSRGYLAGLQNLGTDLESSLEVARRGGVDVFRIRRPVIDYFQGWLATASAAGCVQAGSTPAPPVATAAPARVRPQIAGTYRTDFGELVLTDTGGTYDAGTARIVVTHVYGNTAEGTWTQDNAAERCPNGGFQGRFEFTFTATGFTGRYGRCGEPLTRPWNGRRETAAVAAAPPPAPRPAPATPTEPRRPRLPADTPDFVPLGRVAPLRQGWDRVMYESLRDRVTRMARLREDGRCDDYLRALQQLEADLRSYPGQSRSQLELDGDRRAHQARLDVINHFSYTWPGRFRNGGCSPPIAAGPPPAPPSQAALTPLDPVPGMRPDFQPNTYDGFRSMAMDLAVLRDARQCADYWARLRRFEDALQSSLEAALQRPPDGRWSQRGPHDFFIDWVSRARRRGCGENARAG